MKKGITMMRNILKVLVLSMGAALVAAALPAQAHVSALAARQAALHSHSHPAQNHARFHREVRRDMRFHRHDRRWHRWNDQRRQHALNHHHGHR
jgi:hypothetical protein